MQSNSTGGQKWSKSRSVLKAESAVFALGSDAGCERKTEVKDGVSVSGLSNQRDAAVTT